MPCLLCEEGSVAAGGILLPWLWKTCESTRFYMNAQLDSCIFLFPLSLLFFSSSAVGYPFLRAGVRYFLLSERVRRKHSVTCGHLETIPD